ncbi:triokinase/FMN cyclase-like isoform X2 [Lineus longissimus]|uniref:triokinase/FMN cyclase-like isoform X2 n=1 Tax=Lineus longissimus TaxID=88925 RepID=UPI00315CBD72
MATKKFINSVDRCVDECLAGVVAVNPGLQILEGHRVIIRADIDQVKAAGKVTILCGGGSGHEPAHAGYIGPGMLSGAIAGAVFTSPPPNSILAAIRAVGKGNSGGTLLVVTNYTGDRLNFGIAAERAKAEGIKLEMVIVGEDTALTSDDKTAGRRGLIGTLLTMKITGALADEGKSLEEIVEVANQAVSRMGTIGISASPCSVPGSGPSFQLGQDEMELGLGIHGEAGVRRMKISSAKETLKTMFDHLSSEASSTHLPIKSGDHVALMVNNLGGTSVLELNIMAKEAIDYLESKHVKVDRVYCGTFMTSLEMAGATMTLLHIDDQLKRCLDASTSAPAWSKPLLQPGTTDRVTPKQMAAVCGTSSDKGTDVGSKVDAGFGQKIYKCIKSVCDVLIQSENKLNKLDTEGGDGDCGTTHRRGAEAILKSLKSAGLNVTCPYQLVLSLAHIVEQEMGGSSGALYSLFLSAAALPLMQDTSSMAWFAALEKGISAMARYGGADPGDRTMMDSFHAAQMTLKENMSKVEPLMALELAVKATEEAAESTATMPARAGRASYVSADRLSQPDPGAVAVAMWLKAIYQALV